MASRARTGRSNRRAVVLAAAGVVAASGILGYRHFWLGRPVGEGPAGPEAPRAPFESVWTTRKVLLVGIGDSVTAGFGARRGRSYFERLVRNPPDESPGMGGICLSAVLPNLEARNLALHGSTSLRHFEILRARLEPQPPEVFGIVVMTTGGNDLIHDYGRTPAREGAAYGAGVRQARPWVEAFGRRLDEMMAALGERFPGGCLVFAADIYDFTDGSGAAPGSGLPAWPDGPAILRAYNGAISRLPARHSNVRVVPVHDLFLGHGVRCRQFWRSTYRSGDPTFWYASNFEDPNDRGHDALRRAFLLRIAEAAPRIRALPAGAAGR